MDLKLLYWAMGAAAVGALAVAAVLSRGGPPRGELVRRVWASLPAIAVTALTTLAIGAENAVEARITEALGWDFTWLAFRIEGHAVERIQDAVRSRWLDGPLTLIYTLGAFLTYHLPFYACVLAGRARSAMVVALSNAFVWAVGLVFYLFFPVNEVWMTAGEPYRYTHVVNVLFETLPSTRETPEYLLQLNNNFPSLHVACSAAVALALWRARERWLFALCGPLAVGIAVATVYLGIHWLTDVAAGLALAWAATAAAVRISGRWAGARQTSVDSPPRKRPMPA